MASISSPFCGDCNRLRITADGIAYKCLFATQRDGLDLKLFLQSSGDAATIENAISTFWLNRKDQYSEERHLNKAANIERAEMAYLGG